MGTLVQFDDKTEQFIKNQVNSQVGLMHYLMPPEQLIEVFRRELDYVSRVMVLGTQKWVSEGRDFKPQKPREETS